VLAGVLVVGIIVVFIRTRNTGGAGQAADRQPITTE